MFYAGGYVPPSPDIAPGQRHVTNSSTHSPVVDVNEADFAAEVEQSSLSVFVDFWAPWCGPCRGLEPTFKQLAETYREQIKFVKVNADDNAALMKRFKVRNLPTLLLLRDGQVAEKAGGRRKAALANLLDKHVQRPVALKAAPQRSFRAFHHAAVDAQRDFERDASGRIVSSGLAPERTRAAGTTAPVIPSGMASRTAFQASMACGPCETARQQARYRFFCILRFP
jgi:thioredoxin